MMTHSDRNHTRLALREAHEKGKKSLRPIGKSIDHIIFKYGLGPMALALENYAKEMAEVSDNMSVREPKEWLRVAASCRRISQIADKVFRIRAEEHGDGW